MSAAGGAARSSSTPPAARPRPPPPRPTGSACWRCSPPSRPTGRRRCTRCSNRKAASLRGRSSSSSSRRASTCRSRTASSNGRSRGAPPPSSTLRSTTPRSRSCSGCRRSASRSRSCARATTSRRSSGQARCGLPRTLLTAIVPAAVVSLTWLRLESPVDRPFATVALVLLALAAPVVRPRWPAVVVAVVVAGRLAFGEWPQHVGRIAAHFRRGVLDFYDVKTPFDPRVHTDMRAVVLTAIFAFVLALGLAVATRRVAIAVAVVLLAAGWPATLAAVGSGPIGAAILVAGLVVLAGLTRRRVPRLVVPVVAGLVLAALAASASSAVAKGGLVSWQGWDFYNAPVAPVSVSYVWDAQYGGITFPKKRTRVLEIEAPRHSLFWRAAVLDSFDADHWVETATQRGDSLEPDVGRTELLRQRVHVLALSDTRLVGASVPLSFDAGDAPLTSPSPGFARLPSGLTRGFTYTVESYAPRPTAADLARSRPVYPIEL